MLYLSHNSTFLQGDYQNRDMKEQLTFNGYVSYNDGKYLSGQSKCIMTFPTLLRHFLRK